MLQSLSINDKCSESVVPGEVGLGWTGMTV